MPDNASSSRKCTTISRKRKRCKPICIVLETQVDLAANSDRNIAPYRQGRFTGTPDLGMAIGIASNGPAMAGNTPLEKTRQRRW